MASMLDPCLVSEDQQRPFGRIPHDGTIDHFGVVGHDERKHGLHDGVGNPRNVLDTSIQAVASPRTA